jgi:hypothetical protein
MDGVCSTHGKAKGTSVLVGNLKGRYHIGDVYVNGRIILK